MNAQMPPNAACENCIFEIVKPEKKFPHTGPKLIVRRARRQPSRDRSQRFFQPKICNLNSLQCQLKDLPSLLGAHPIRSSNPAKGQRLRLSNKFLSAKVTL